MTNDLNQDTTNDDDEVMTQEEAPVDELTHLKKKADTMGIKYASRIGVEKLREKINAKLNGDPDEDDPEEIPEVKTLSKAEQVAATRKKMNKEQMFLVRLRISNLNPSKKELDGEYFTVVNKYLGAVRKFVPYGAASDNGYHVPFIIYQELKNRKFNSVRTKSTNGQIQVIQKWVPEFSLEVMEPLTLKEIQDLAASQAATRGTE